jgi:predicted nucleotidyltransferase
MAREVLQALISSRVRTKVLTLFLMHPDQEYHLKGLVQELSENNNALRRELNRLAAIGLLHSQWRGSAKFYQVDRKHPLYPELRSIVVKTTGLGETLRNELAALGNVQWAAVYGSFAAGEVDARSDIDLMLVGTLNLESLRRVLGNLERRLDREINETVYDPEEFARRRNEGDAFLERVMGSPKIVVLGDADALD